MEVDANKHVGPGHLSDRGSSIERKNLAVAHEPDLTHANVGLEWIDIGPAVADRTEDSTPVWIGAIDR